ncbi:adenylate/guanylate cyclase domain-containing protein [Spirochaetia bacterium]|nr:adenylate/guanylate cyclase domain-containing protein [Spirochaetia bacterium]
MDRTQGQDREIRVRHPIGIKLVLITAVLLLISLGTLTILVSYMVSQDLRITAEDNNFSVNRRSAAAAETALQTIRSNALTLLDTLSVVGAPDGDVGVESDSTLAKQILAFYLERNREVAAIVIHGDEPGAVVPFVNDTFFAANGVNADLIDVWGNQAEETAILNATPAFDIPLLALVFPWKQGRAVTVLFSPEELIDAFSGSVNASCLVNHRGDILVHPDSALVLAGATMGRDPLMEMMQASPERNRQTLYTDAEGTRYFGAWRKLSEADAAVLTTVESRLIYEGIAATTRRNIFLTAAVLFLSIIFIWYFSKSISTPLIRLAVTAGEIEAGQFEMEPTEKASDEIGFLAESFEKMSKALVSFGRFTNREIAKRAMRGDLALGGEPRMATLLFTDIRSFTMMSEMLEPWEVVEFLNNYMTRMVTCIDENGGTVDKFMGDAIMAHWGAVTILNTPAVNALNAVKAALAMRSALQQFNAGQDGSIKQPRVRIGCGINTGPVVAGQIGSDKRMEYTVIGDTVNLASRTEGLNKKMRTDILITEETWKLVGSHLITEAMPRVRVKGKTKSIRVHAVINLRAEPGEPQSQPETLEQVRALLGYATPDMGTIEAVLETIEADNIL